MSCYSFLFVGTDSSLMVAVFVTVPPCILSTNNLLYFQTQNKYRKKATEIRLVDVNDNKAIWCHCVDCGLTPQWPWLWYDMVWGWQSLGHSQWNLVSCFPVFILQCQIVIANINLRWQESSERRGACTEFLMTMTPLSVIWLDGWLKHWIYIFIQSFVI